MRNRLTQAVAPASDTCTGTVAHSFLILDAYTSLPISGERTKIMRREGVTYELHHIGIPTDEVRPGERYTASVDMCTTDDLTGPLPIQSHRFGPNCKLAEPMRSQPHISYKRSTSSRWRSKAMWLSSVRTSRSTISVLPSSMTAECRSSSSKPN